ncbi:MAG: PQQ-dependent sugar dehydrogenase, partial [Rhodothermales bacterium]|nr:PQQ-dependent sugar dehydrogenase [Rhodothermales bacterium]
RIRPEPDGTYSIPEGNLFPSDGSAGRPEIYAMGLRNPFRIDVDPVRGWVYWGDVGPDASNDSFLRGPRGYDEWNQAKAAGNFGWPYCIADNKAYRDYDFATGASGPSFACSSPVNESPNNTGTIGLPPAQAAWIWYPYGPSSEFPEISDGPGRTAMAGPVYQYNPASPKGSLPAYFDGGLFIYEWSRRWLKYVHLDDDGDLLGVNDFLPSETFRRPIDMHVGPDGAAYVVEWGSSFGGNNSDARVSKITYLGGDSTAVGKEPEVAAPARFELAPVYPNPATGKASVKVFVPESRVIEIAIFDLLGRRVRTLGRQSMSVGDHEVVLPVSDLPSAMYFVRVFAGNEVLTRPLVAIN